MTKKERHDIYKRLYDIINDGKHINSPWMCNILRHEFGLNIKQMPELVKQMPQKGADGYNCYIGSAWFMEGDIESRLKLLTKCMNETMPTKRK